jgi:hypothetical protein
MCPPTAQHMESVKQQLCLQCTPSVNCNTYPQSHTNSYARHQNTVRTRGGTSPAKPLRSAAKQAHNNHKYTTCIPLVNALIDWGSSPKLLPAESASAPCCCCTSSAVQGSTPLSLMIIAHRGLPC